VGGGPELWGGPWAVGCAAQPLRHLPLRLRLTAAASPSFHCR
jgi:hypothetical protein